MRVEYYTKVFFEITKILIFERKRFFEKVKNISIKEDKKSDKFKLIAIYTYLFGSVFWKIIFSKFIVKYRITFRFFFSK